jgi:polyhydroxyalkanoate synthesis regulator phasin
LRVIREHPAVKKLLSTGEEQLSKIAAQVLSNEKFVATLQVVVQRSLEAKGMLDRTVQRALSGMNIPTTKDVAKLGDRLADLEQALETLERKIEQLDGKLGK